MRYVDRNGAAMSAREWRRKSRDRNYCQVCPPVACPGAVLDATWLGVVLPGETRPTPFVVRVRRAGSAEPSYLWCASEAQTKDVLEGAILDLLDGAPFGADEHCPGR